MSDFNTLNSDTLLRNPLGGFDDPLLTPEQKETEEKGLFYYLKDIGKGITGGVEGAAKGAYDLGDFLLFDALPDYDERFLWQSETVAGGLVEGITQFGVGMMAGGPLVKAGMKATGLAGKGLKGGKFAKEAIKAKRAAKQARAVGKFRAARKLEAKAKGIELAGDAAFWTGAGAVTDFAFFDSHEARLSNLVQSSDILNNAVTEYLAADEEDGFLEGRFKNLVEGAALGGAIDSVLTLWKGLRVYKHGLKEKNKGKSASKVLDAMRKKSEEIEKEPQTLSELPAFVGDRSPNKFRMDITDPETGFLDLPIIRALDDPAINETGTIDQLRGALQKRSGTAKDTFDWMMFEIFTDGKKRYNKTELKDFFSGVRIIEKRVGRGEPKSVSPYRDGNSPWDSLIANHASRGNSDSYGEIVLQYKMPESRVDKDTQFNVKHFPLVDQPLGHFRYTILKDSKGSRYLHLEEVQSDWKIQVTKDKNIRTRAETEIKQLINRNLSARALKLESANTILNITNLTTKQDKLRNSQNKINNDLFNLSKNKELKPEEILKQRKILMAQLEKNKKELDVVKGDLIVANHKKTHIDRNKVEKDITVLTDLERAKNRIPSWLQNGKVFDLLMVRAAKHAQDLGLDGVSLASGKDLETIEKIDYRGQLYDRDLPKILKKQAKKFGTTENVRYEALQRGERDMAIDPATGKTIAEGPLVENLNFALKFSAEGHKALDDRLSFYSPAYRGEAFAKERFSDSYTGSYPTTVFPLSQVIYENPKLNVIAQSEIRLTPAEQRFFEWHSNPNNPTDALMDFKALGIEYNPENKSLIVKSYEPLEMKYEGEKFTVMQDDSDDFLYTYVEYYRDRDRTSANPEPQPAPSIYNGTLQARINEALDIAEAPTGKSRYDKFTEISKREKALLDQQKTTKEFQKFLETDDLLDRLPKQNKNAVQFVVGKLSSLLKDVKVEVVGGMEGKGVYDWNRRLISISSGLLDNPNLFGRTAIHELWHAASRLLTDSQVDSLYKSYLKDLENFKLKDPEGFERVQKAQKGEGKFTADEYRYANFDEWVVENLTDSSIARQQKLDDASKSFMKYMSLVVTDLVNMIKAKFGKETTNNIVRDMFRENFVAPAPVNKTLEARASNLPQPLNARSFMADTEGVGRGSTKHDGLLDNAQADNEGFTDMAKELFKAVQSDNPEAALKEFPLNLRNLNESGDPVQHRLFVTGAFKAARDEGYFKLDSDIVQNQEAFSNKAGEIAQDLISLKQSTGATLFDSHLDILQEAESVLRTGGSKTFNFGGEQLGVIDAVNAINQQVQVARELEKASVKMIGEKLDKALSVDGTSRDVMEAMQMLHGHLTLTKNVSDIGTAQARGLRQWGSTAKESIYITKEDTQNADRVLAFMEEIGGMDKAKQRLRKIRRTLDLNDPAPFTETVRKTRAGLLDVTMSYWLNSILSGPVTHAVNVVSGGLTTAFLPVEAMLGAGVRALKPSETRQQLAIMAEQASVMANLIFEFDDAIKLAFKSLWKDRNLLDPNVRINEMTPTQLKYGPELQLENESLARASARYIFRGSGLVKDLGTLPSRFLAAEDEFFKQWNYRARVRAGITRDLAADIASGKITKAEAARTITTVLDKGVGDGEHFSKQNVHRQALAKVDEARQAGKINTPEDADRIHKDFMQENYEAVEGFKDIADSALDYAREATFTRPLNKDAGGLEGVSAKWQTIVNSHPYLRILTPFVRTPVNLMLFFGQRFLPAAGYFPLGNKLHKRFAEDMASKNPQLRAEATGRFATGAAMFGAAAYMVMNGNITGGGPTDPEQRKTMELAGWQPYSIRIGETYYSYKRFDPFSTFLGIVADSVETYNISDERNRETLDAAIGASVLAVSRNIQNKSYLSGMVRIFQALSQPEKYGQRTMESLIASFVPYGAFMSQTRSKTDDPYYREVRSIVEAIKNRTYAAEELAPKRNVLGEPIKRQGALGPDFISPMSYTTVSDDVIYNELKNLGHGFTAPSIMKNNLDLTTYTNNKGQSAHDRYSELHGEVRLGGKTLRDRLTTLIQSNRYQSLAGTSTDEYDSPRIALIRRLIGKYRRAAYNQTLQEFDDLRNDDTVTRQNRKALRSGSNFDNLQALIGR